MKENDKRHNPPQIVVMGLTLLPLMVILLVCTPLPRLVLKWLGTIPWTLILRQVPPFAMTALFAPVGTLMECAYIALARWRLTDRETFMAWLGGTVGVTYCGVVVFHLIRSTDYSLIAVLLGVGVVLLYMCADPLVLGCQRLFLRLMFPDYLRSVLRLKQASRDVDSEYTCLYVPLGIDDYCIRLPEPLTDCPEWVDRNMPLLEQCANYCPDLFDSLMCLKAKRAAAHEK